MREKLEELLKLNEGMAVEARERLDAARGEYDKALYAVHFWERRRKSFDALASECRELIAELEGEATT